MDDVISRQAAIDAINQICPIDTEYDCTLLDRVDVRCVLTELPSAQPDRKNGTWVPVTNGRGGHECDQCHNYAPSYSTGEERLSDYCPNCGAKMGEEGKDD